MRVNIIGHGRTGKELVRLLNRLSYGCDVFDETEQKGIGHPNTFTNVANLHKHIENTAVISPGVRPSKRYLKYFKNIISEYDLIYYLVSVMGSQETAKLSEIDTEHIRSTYKPDRKLYSIWISGTNGKTTTTEMMSRMVPDAKVGGNIGVPLAELVLNNLKEAQLESRLESSDENHIKIIRNGMRPEHAGCEIEASCPGHTETKRAWLWILETSSFSMHYTQVAAPDAYLLLNISHDHIDWHGGFEPYIRAKLKVVKRMGRESVCIMPNDPRYSKLIAEYTKGYEGEVFLFSNTQDVIERFGLDSRALQSIREPFRLNLALSMALLSICHKRHGIRSIDIEHHEIGKHRMQEIGNDFLLGSMRENLIFVNDSKATNPHATIHAIKQYSDRHIYLIMGGDSKGVDMSELLAHIAGSNNIELFVIGRDRKIILNQLSNFGRKNDCKDMKSAVSIISSKVKSGAGKQVVMLSPACASTDQYDSYIQRGEEFEMLVRGVFGEFQIGKGGK